MLALRCEAAGQGALDVPLDVHSICTRVGLPQARAAAVIAVELHDKETMRAERW